jgi:preprotein translocase subunit YajC
MQQITDYLAANSWIVYIVLIGAMFYFMIIRPNKKRMDDQRLLLNSLSVGSRVMLTAGIIGTVKVIGETQIVVELAPGVEVTALKQVVARVLGTDDEEFEYSDDDTVIEPGDAYPHASESFSATDSGDDAPSESDPTTDARATSGDSPDFI